MTLDDRYQANVCLTWTASRRNCEAQGKGRAKGRPRKVTKRSFMDGGWWLVVYLSLMLYIKVGCHPPTHHHPPGRLILLN